MFTKHHSSKVATPLPKLQLFIVLYFQLSEPITSLVISPFINQMIYEYGITNDEKKVGYYAGTVTSTFFFTEMICIYHWGRISDRIGRRPVLMTGVVGLICSSLSFGVSKSFLGLMFSRALSGALNGNTGVMKSMMGEITDETNQAQAFSFLPLINAGGTGIASFIGGGLAHPYERFPKLFGHFKFWKEYPYALPCFVSAAFCFSTFVFGFFFLKESLHTKERKLAANSYGTSKPTSHSDTVENTSPSQITTLLPKITAPAPPPFREVLTPRVRAAILNYATFALLNITFVSLQPLIMSTPISLGGLGLGTPTIGLIVGVTGIVSGVFQMIFFAPLHRAFGTRALLLVAVAAYSLLYLSWPVMSFLAKRAGKVDAITIVVLIFQQLVYTLSGMGFSCTHIFTTSAAPTLNALGTTNGLAQTLVSFSRAVGPASAASLFAFSLEHNVMGGQFVYVVLVFLVGLSFWVAMQLPKVVKRASDENAE